MSLISFSFASDWSGWIPTNIGRLNPEYIQTDSSPAIKKVFGSDCRVYWKKQNTLCFHKLSMDFFQDDSFFSFL